MIYLRSNSMILNVVLSVVMMLSISSLALGANMSVSPGVSGAGTGTEIQEAIDDVEALGGGVVTVEAGSFFLSHPLLVPGKVTLQGEGVGTILVNYGVAAGRGLIENKYLNPAYSAIPEEVAKQDGWSIRNLRLSSGQNNDARSGIRSVGRSTAERPNNLTISDVTVEFGTNGYECNLSCNAKVINFNTRSSSTGIHQVDCADNDYVNVSVQSGDDWGFVFGQQTTGAFNEGTRCVNCSTNGQAGGVHIDGADFVTISNSSFTTAPTLGGVLITNGSVNWSIDNSEIAAAGDPPGMPGLVVGADSHRGNLSNSKIILNTFGAVMSSNETAYNRQFICQQY